MTSTSPERHYQMITENRLKWFVLLLLLLPSICFSGGNQTNQSFNKAKKILLRDVYQDQHQTFYCNSTFDSQKQVQHNGGYIPVKDNKRANRLEWEHIVPAHAFGQSFKEWREGDQACVDSKGNHLKVANVQERSTSNTAICKLTCTI